MTRTNVDPTTAAAVESRAGMGSDGDPEMRADLAPMAPGFPILRGPPGHLVTDEMVATALDDD